MSQLQIFSSVHFFPCLCQSVWRRWSVCGKAASPSACVSSPIPFPILSASHWCSEEGGRVWTCVAHRVRRRSAGSGASELSKTVSPTWAKRRSSINILQFCFQFVARTSGLRGTVLNQCHDLQVYLFFLCTCPILQSGRLACEIDFNAVTRRKFQPLAFPLLCSQINTQALATYAVKLKH